MKHKYVTFSFDDRFSNFVENAYPIFNLYHFKATLNIITGFSDKTIDNRWPRLNPIQVKQLCDQGFEIVMHSNSHLHNETPEVFYAATKNYQNGLVKKNWRHDVCHITKSLLKD